MKTTRFMKRLILMLAMLISISTTFISCRDTKDNKMETQGDRIENDMNSTGDEIEDAGDAVENAAEETGDAIDDAANEVQGNDDY
jgi:predicted small secreted protein